MYMRKLTTACLYISQETTLVLRLERTAISTFILQIWTPLLRGVFCLKMVLLPSAAAPQAGGNDFFLLKGDWIHLVEVSPFLPRETTFCGFLFVLLYTKPLLKKGPLCKENICSFLGAFLMSATTYVFMGK